MAITRKMRTAAAMGAALALLVSGCGDDSAGGGGGGGGDGGGDAASLEGAELTVGAKEFTESKVLAQITAQALANAGATIDDSSLSGSATVREALEAGEIDMYWEYTGTGWVNILGNTTEDVPEDLFAAVAEADMENEIAWLPQAPMEDTYRIAVTSEFAEENSLATMSDAAAYIQENEADGTVCAASEFINRDDGLPGLEEAYGFEFSEVVELDLGLIYTQVGDTCNFGEVFSTDGRILSNELVVLEDDEEFFVKYNAALTLRQETLDEFPAIAEIMAPISEAITSEVITALNSAVDNDGETEEDVATQFLEDNGFLD
ncbi:MAG: glycine/betaine ABC transporter substrate-binding protein [Geodermatophilaceae bacterium]|nr:glycine/betaine ABC transporter substrate-binding protein [Geodermatophilaceae bacterium]